MYNLWIVALLVVCSGTSLAEEEVGSPLRVAQCRAKCIYTFGSPSNGFDDCIRDNECFMCWEKCQLFESNFVVWGTVCSKPPLCGGGCQLACQFHRSAPPQRGPVQVTQGQRVVSRTGSLVSWPPPAQLHTSEPLVYVLLRGEPWRQLLQTTDLSAQVTPTSRDSQRLRVLVVGKDGLVTIFSPVTGAESPLSGAEEVLRRVSSEALLALRLPGPSNNRINTQLYTQPSQDPLDMLKDVEAGWNLRKMSLIHQKVLVIVEIAWNSQTSWGAGARALKGPGSAGAVYFVTWEVEGGGLRGNLFTDATSVTLSLWPDTVYHIQVELVRHDWKQVAGGQSETLVVDTRTVTSRRGWSEPLGQAPGAPVRVPLPRPTGPHVHVTVLAGASASLLTFLTVLAVFAWRYRLLARAHAKGGDLEQRSAVSTQHVYRVYPPAVRLGSLDQSSSVCPTTASTPIPSVCGGTST